MREARAARVQPGNVIFLCALAWAVPGAAHVWLRQSTKGLIFLAMLLSMFAVGLALQGRLFQFDSSDPLVALAFLPDLGIGLPYVVSRALGLGAGQVTAVTFEYANTFLIVAGLLNLLVVLDARDIVLGRKPGTRPERPR